MYLLLIPVALYLVAQKWEKVKPFIPASLLMLTQRPAELVNMFHAVFLFSTFFYLFSFPLEWGAYFMGGSRSPALTPVDGNASGEDGVETMDNGASAAEVGSGDSYLGFLLRYLAGFFGIFYSVALATGICASLVTIIANNGPPPAKEGWEKIKIYLATVQQSLEFAWLFYGFIFLSADPMVLILLIPARRSLSAVLKFSKKKLEEFSKMPATAGNPYVKQILAMKPQLDALEQKDEQLQAYAALGELVLGFMLLMKIAVIGMGGVFTALLYWQLLRMKFHHPKMRAKQIAAWKVVGERANPLLEKAPPVQAIVQKGIDYYCKPLQ